MADRPSTAEGKARLKGRASRHPANWLVRNVPTGADKPSLLRSLLRQLRWLIFGVPKGRKRGRWVYNSWDSTWRYYLDDIEVS